MNQKSGLAVVVAAGTGDVVLEADVIEFVVVAGVDAEIGPSK